MFRKTVGLFWLGVALTSAACATLKATPIERVGDLAPPSAASKQDEEAAASNPDPSHYDELVVVGTNDFHGYLRPVEVEVNGEKIVQAGAEWFSGHAKILAEKYGDHLILLDGGDLFQGTMESNLFQGKSVMDYLNLLPYRAAAVGNHEFDYGPSNQAKAKEEIADRMGALKDRINQANFPFLQANIFKKKDGKIWREKNLLPSALIKAGNYKVGLIGLSTTSTPSKTLPTNVVSLEFRDFLAPTLSEAKALRKKGADVILIVCHEGGNKPMGPVYELLKALPAGTVDGVVSGHTHAEYHEKIFGVPVIQSRSRGQYFGRFDLFIDKKTRKVAPALTRIHDIHWICGTWFKNENSCDPAVAKKKVAEGKAADLFPLRPVKYEGQVVHPDAKVHEAMEPYFGAADKKKAEVLGFASRDYDYYPSGEPETADLWLAGYRKFFPEAKVIYLNGGGYRRRLFKGQITYGDIYEVHPFDNYMAEVRMTGAQLKDLVRVGVSGANSIPSIWGVRVEYYGDFKPEYARDVNGDGKKERWEQDRLVPKTGLVWEDSGKPVEDSEEFWLATNDYLASGGDNLDHVFGQIPLSKRKYLDIVQREAAVEYLRAHPSISLPEKGESRIRKIQ
jgi:5'-nucleotidase